MQLFLNKSNTNNLVTGGMLFSWPLYNLKSSRYGWHMEKLTLRTGTATVGLSVNVMFTLSIVRLRSVSGTAAVRFPSSETLCVRSVETLPETSHGNLAVVAHVCHQALFFFFFTKNENKQSCITPWTLSAQALHMTVLLPLGPVLDKHRCKD